MNTKLTFTEKKDTRSGFGVGLLEAAQENENIVGLCADLTGSLKMGDFKKEFPERFFQAICSHKINCKRNTYCYNDTGKKIKPEFLVSVNLFKLTMQPKICHGKICACQKHK